MKRNPLLPFALIAVLGVGIMFILSFQGLNKADKLAKEKENGGGKSEEVAKNPEDIVQASCISCHGNSLEGGMGPALDKIGATLSEDEIKDIIVNGVPGTAMPAGLVQGEENQTAVAKWLSEKK